MTTTTALTIFEDGSALDRATRLASLPEGERRRAAVEACRDYDAAALWEIADAWLTTSGGAGARTSAHTRRAYQRGVQDLVQAWHKGGQSLLRPPRDAGALWVRSLEATKHATSTVRVRLAGARALYAGLRWAGATEADPFRDARPAKDPCAGRSAHPSTGEYCDLDQQQSHVLSAHRLHEAWESAALGWFPMPHKNPAEWILMHRPCLALQRLLLDRRGVIGCTRGAHVVHHEPAKRPG